MKIQSLLIAVALACGASAFAAPNDTAKSPSATPAPLAVKKPVRHTHAKLHARKHTAKVAHARKHVAGKTVAADTSVSPASTPSREARMNDALNKFHQGGGRS